MGAADEPMKVLFTSSVRQFILENVYSERVAAAIDRQREMLALFPEMGRRYDPIYEAAFPPSHVGGLPFPTRRSRSTTPWIPERTRLSSFISSTSA